VTSISRTKDIVLHKTGTVHKSFGKIVYRSIHLKSWNILVEGVINETKYGHEFNKGNTQEW
jgi:hypothetical protein